MHKLVKVLLASGLSMGVYKKIQAMRQSISLESQLVKDVLPHINFLPIPKNDIEMARYIENSRKPYVLPKSVSTLYDFKPMATFDDTLEYGQTSTVQQSVIFYIHGGAYWNQPTFFHYKTLVTLSKKLTARVVMPIYPKAPAYTAKDVLKMVTERYLYLIHEEGVNPSDITVMGDSAGGGCSLSLLQILKEQNQPLPNQAILLSPWLDVNNTNDQMDQIQPYDVMLNRESLRYQGQIYAGDLSLKDPLVSPLYGTYADYPLITIFTGTHDILYVDSKELSQKAKQNKWPITVYAYDKIPHVFSILPTPEGKDSLEKIVDIIKHGANVNI